jgi:6,7-dimethyl-8-ribityllumazine synthase
MAKVKLKPGGNELTDADFDKLKAHPDYDKFIGLGVIVEGETEEAKEVKPISRGRKKPVPTSPLLVDSPQG